MSNETQPWVAIDMYETPTNVLLFATKSFPFSSKLKNVFWKIMGLFILQIDGFIKQNDFSMVVREYLLDFTDNQKLLDETVSKVFKILLSVKYPKTGTMFNNTDNYTLRTVPEDIKEEKRKIIFQFSGQHPIPNLTDILPFSDFCLANRIELCTVAVLNETGFGEFNRNVKNEVRKIKKSICCDQPIYDKVIDDVMEHTAYLTNRTYGTLYKILYYKILTSFVDKL